MEAAQVYVMAGVCLVLGLGIGYLLRASQPPNPPVLASVRSVASVRSTQPPPGARMRSLEQMRQMADKQAAPMLEKLKTNPNDSALLARIGASYLSTHQFSQAAVYYGRAVQVDPKNVVLRTSLASSLYLSGDADGAISQLNQALKYNPTDADALFNLGLIKLKAKDDDKGALAAWRQLLKTNPKLGPDKKAEVQRLVANVMTEQANQQAAQGARQQ